MYLAYRKAVVSGAAAAVILGACGTAVAVSASDTTDGKPSGDPTATQQTKDKSNNKGKHKHARKGKIKKALQRLDHASITTKDKDGKTVTQQLIRGPVTAVSATSVTVRSAGGTSRTYSVSDETKVAQVSVSGAERPQKSSISKVAKGDQVFVSGTGTNKLAAVRIIEIAK